MSLHLIQQAAWEKLIQEIRQLGKTYGHKAPSWTSPEQLKIYLETTTF